MTFNNEEHPTKTHQLVYSENWRSKLAYILNNDEFIKPSWNHPIRIDGYHGCIAPNRTVKEDINLIDTSDIVFAFLNRPGLDGTVVELMHAANQHKPIFCMVTPDKNYDNLKNFYRKFPLPSTEYDDNMGGYSGEYWFLLTYLNITLKHKLFAVESNMSWNNLGDIDEGVKIKTDFMMFLTENGFILTNYDKYINSKEWQQKSLAVRTQSKGICKLCNRNVGTHNLCVHHKQYPKNFIHDNYKNWIVICKECHEKIHGTDK